MNKNEQNSERLYEVLFIVAKEWGFGITPEGILRHYDDRKTAEATCIVAHIAIDVLGIPGQQVAEFLGYHKRTLYTYRKTAAELLKSEAAQVRLTRILVCLNPQTWE